MQYLNTGILPVTVWRTVTWRAKLNSHCFATASSILTHFILKYYCEYEARSFCFSELQHLPCYLYSTLESTCSCSSYSSTVAISFHYKNTLNFIGYGGIILCSCVTYLEHVMPSTYRQYSMNTNITLGYQVMLYIHFRNAMSQKYLRMHRKTLYNLQSRIMQPGSVDRNNFIPLQLLHPQQLRISTAKQVIRSKGTFRAVKLLKQFQQYPLVLL